MIQFKKIPPGKSVLLLVLFLTTNISGFLQDYQQENEISRKTQNRFSMDLQQPSTRNMPIRRTGINRVINEKDGNSERLYDRRSFRTGTIQRGEDLDAERSVERSRTDIRDVNNNRQRFASNSQDKLKYTRDNRRSRDSTISRENRQVQNVRDRRMDERTQTSANRQYNERSLNTRTKRDLNHRAESSSEIRAQRNLDIRGRRINDIRIDSESQLNGIQIRDRQYLTRRTSLREMSQRFAERSIANARLHENRATSEVARRSLETRRSIRSVERDRRVSEERKIPQRRSTERSERRNSRETPLEARTVENRDDRISERREVEQRQLSFQVRNSKRVLPSSERNSRENFMEIRNVENRDRRTSLSRNADQRSLSSKTRNQILSSTEPLQRNSRENGLETRTFENRNTDQRQLSSQERNSNQVLSSTERLQRNSRGNLPGARAVVSRNHRFSLNRNTDQIQLASEVRNIDRTLRSTRRLQRNSRDSSMQRRTAEDRDRRVSERLLSLHHNSPSAERMVRNNNLETRGDETLGRKIFEKRNLDRSRSVDSRIVRNRSERDTRGRLTLQHNSPSAERMVRNNLETRSDEARGRKIFQRRNLDRSRSVDSRIVRNRSERDTRGRLSKHSLGTRDTGEIRLVRDNRERDQTRRETQDLSRRLTGARQTTIDLADQTFSERSSERLQRIDSRGIRRISQRRERNTARAAATRGTTVDERRISRQDRNINNRKLSRSDSTRYIQDNTYFRDARLAHRDDSARTTRVNTLGMKNSMRENYFATDRYNSVTADSRRYFEKDASQSKKTVNSEIPVLNLENNAYTWANTVKIILVAFLVGQIFVNSSKANKFRFHNIMSMATSIKEKIQ